MKLILSLTSIPTRFDKLPPLIEHLKQQGPYEIWVNIPQKYKRFPDWDGIFPWTDLGENVVINRDCDDWGPGTQAMGPIAKTDADLIVYVNDDTLYHPDMTKQLMIWQSVDARSAWGLSGFNFENYFKGQYPRTHGIPVDVLESYGAVIAKVSWLKTIFPEFVELSAVTWNDDILISNLFQKHNIPRKTVYTTECNLGQLKQLEYGFGTDALHHLAAEASGTTALTHTENNKKILMDLDNLGKNYYKFICVGDGAGEGIGEGETGVGAGAENGASAGARLGKTETI